MPDSGCSGPENVQVPAFSAGTRPTTDSGRKGIRMSKTKTIAVFGVGPGMGRAVARRFGREGFQVALVARNQTRLDAFTTDECAAYLRHAGYAAN